MKRERRAQRERERRGRALSNPLSNLLPLCRFSIVIGTRAAARPSQGVLEDGWCVNSIIRVLLYSSARLLGWRDPAKMASNRTYSQVQNA